MQKQLDEDHPTNFKKIENLRLYIEGKNTLFGNIYQNLNNYNFSNYDHHHLYQH